MSKRLRPSEKSIVEHLTGCSAHSLKTGAANNFGASKFSSSSYYRFLNPISPTSAPPMPICLFKAVHSVRHDPHEPHRPISDIGAYLSSEISLPRCFQQGCLVPHANLLTPHVQRPCRFMMKRPPSFATGRPQTRQSGSPFGRIYRNMEHQSHRPTGVCPHHRGVDIRIFSAVDRLKAVNPF